MTPAQYDAWYHAPRGRWIGETEYRLLRRVLAPRAGESVLDVGCGTGYFTRRFAADGHPATGLDRDPGMLEVARANCAAGERYLQGDALELPFPDGAFDLSVSVAALCFIADDAAALAEMLRVTRRRVALGLLNRCSLLYLRKGRHGGVGAYRGARWDTAGEVRELFARAGGDSPRLESAIFFPSGGPLARAVEKAVPASIPCGAILAAAA